MTTVSIVIPTVGRPSLRRLLDRLEAAEGPRPALIVVVDDRPGAPEPLDLPDTGWLADVLTVRYTAAAGPAAARNVGWRACRTEWVAFLDDDVLIAADWLDCLADDLDSLPETVAGSQGCIEVPLPTHRRPTDWERGTAGLATARWITADMAYRRAALQTVGGFDERFPRAFREDADLALRIQQCGWRLVLGTRRTTHPVRPASWRASLDQQRGNADDVLMTKVHGPDWHRRAGAPRGRLPGHLATTAAVCIAAVGLARGHRRLAAAAGAGWAALTTEFATARIAPGPRDVDEIARMLVTSALIPPAATGHWLRGWVRHRRVRRWAPVAAVLFDRDGTLVHDEPYNGRPDLVRPVDGARAAVARLRDAGLRVGVVSNQSGVARGLLGVDDVRAVNARVDELIGPFDTWQFCPHDDGDGCRCRKPQPGMVLAAARELGVPVEQCIVVGDTAADLAAATAAGAAGAILVPNAATLAAEVRIANWTAPDLAAAVDAVLARAGRVTAPTPAGELARAGATRSPA